MGGKSSGQVAGYRYFMSVHMGLARGPLDEIIEISIGDKQAWTGSITGNSRVRIEKPDLFGGEEAEGGIVGDLDVYMGAEDQIVPAGPKDLIGGGVSDWRGVATMFFDGMIAAINPYPKPWKVRMRRSLKGWDGPVWQPSFAQIPMAGGKIMGMNGAHILYECITNRKWGRGLNRSWVDELACSRAAETLFKEGLGLNLRWNRQTELGSFVQSVLNHIGGALYIDRQTGLVTLKLIRQDYDADSLPIFDKNSGLLEITEDESGSPEAAVNEVIVSFNDPLVDDVRQVRAHNLASIQTLGYKNSTTVNYPGLATSELAGRLALRDLRAQSVTMRRYKCVFDRRAWKIPPAGVFRISAPERGIQSLVLRAGDIRDTTLKDGKITVTAILDVFGLPASSYVAQVDSTWTPPDTVPVPATVRRVEEATYRSLCLVLTPAQVAAFLPTSGAIQTVARKPTPLSLGYTVASKAAGEDYATPGPMMDWTSTAILAAPLSRWGSTITVASGAELSEVEVGQAVQIDDEVMEIKTWDPLTLTATLGRGCVDTIPAPHASAASVFFIDTGMNTDLREYESGETVDVKLLTRTTGSTLALADAPVNSVGLYGRQGRPYLPGKMLVNGNRFDVGVTVHGSVNLTWAARNRLVSMDALFDHEATSQAMELNGGHRVEIMDGATVVRSTDVPGGTNDLSYALDDQNLDFTIAPGGSKAITIRVSAFTYDAAAPLFLSSWWSYEIPVTLSRVGSPVGGYGTDYGTSYGT